MNQPYSVCSEKDIPHFSKLYGIDTASGNRIFCAAETIAALANAGEKLDREIPRFEKLFHDGVTPDIISAEMDNCFGTNVTSIAWLEIPEDIRYGDPIETFRYWAKELREASALAKPYCSALAGPNREDVLIQQCFDSEITVPEIRVSFYPIFSDSDGGVCVCETYSAYRIDTAVTMLFQVCLKDNVYLKICKNCGQYFAPVSKSNEIYCSSCRYVTYDSRIKDDPVLTHYRKIYKTQNSRKNRNFHIPNIEKRFQRWVAYASSVRDKCIAEEITLDEMISAISGKDWMTQK